MLGNRGLPQFDEQDCKQSIEAIKQTGGLVGRVRFREGLPHLQVLGTLLVGENGGEILANDLRL